VAGYVAILSQRAPIGCCCVGSCLHWVNVSELPMDVQVTVAWFGGDNISSDGAGNTSL
jgi:hypothetical protein